jgi:hypothetical protein
MCLFYYVNNGLFGVELIAQLFYFGNVSAVCFVHETAGVGQLLLQSGDRALHRFIDLKEQAL